MSTELVTYRLLVSGMALWDQYMLRLPSEHDRHCVTVEVSAAWSRLVSCECGWKPYGSSH